MWYLAMSPGSTSTTTISVPAFSSCFRKTSGLLHQRNKTIILWHLAMSPESASTTVMALPEFSSCFRKTSGLLHQRNKTIILWHLAMSPASASTTAMALPEFSSCFRKTSGLLHQRNKTVRLVEGNPGFIDKIHLRPVVMAPVLVLVYQHAAAAAITKWQSEASIWMSSATSSWY